MKDAGHGGTCLPFRAPSSSLACDTETTLSQNKINKPCHFKFFISGSQLPIKLQVP